MSASAYMVTVTNLTRGWTMTSTSEALTAPSAWENPAEDLTLRRVLVSPFLARWGFKDGLVPNPMDADRVTINMWARTIADEYVADIGDVMTVTATLGAPGNLILYTTTARVSEASSDLVPTDPWASRSKIELTGFTADLSSTNMDGTASSFSYKTWWLLWEWVSRRPVFIPSGTETSAVATDNRRTSETLASMAERLSNTVGLSSFMPATYDPVNPNTPPGGYTRPPWNTGDGPYLGGSPNSPIRYILVPASRRETSAVTNPLEFIVRDAQVTVTSTPGPSTTRRNPALSASVCRIPTNVRRTRDHIVNDARLVGAAKSTSTIDYKPTTGDVLNATDAANRGRITREVPTALIIRNYDPGTGVESGMLADATDLGTLFLSDASVLASSRAYQSLDVYPHLMHPDEAAKVLPYLIPHVPGRQGLPASDSRILRHVTVYSVDESLTSPAFTPGGFITGGELSIERGMLRYRLTTTPGQPIYLAGAPGPGITLGQFTAKTFAPTYKVSQLDPSLTVSDLDMIGA